MPLSDRQYQLRATSCSYSRCLTPLTRFVHHSTRICSPLHSHLFTAPLALLHAEEWTSNRKLIDTSGKGLRRVIPKGFAYFHVGWKGGGFVHPIEDEDEFPPSFGIDTAAGMLGLPPGECSVHICVSV